MTKLFAIVLDDFNEVVWDCAGSFRQSCSQSCQVILTELFRIVSGHFDMFDYFEDVLDCVRSFQPICSGLCHFYRIVRDVCWVILTELFRFMSSHFDRFVQDSVGSF